MTSKPVIFISHITEESALAKLIKDTIEKKFLRHVEVFVSSSKDISLGSQWLKTIESKLKECCLMLIISSPNSVERPWINFECGAGWIRGIQVIPMCHSGMTRNDLPMPMNMLQAINMNDAAALDRLFETIAQELKGEKPEIDIEQLVNEVKAFEAGYTAKNYSDNDLATIRDVNPRFFAEIKNATPGITTSINLNKEIFDHFSPELTEIFRKYNVRFSWKMTALELYDDADGGIVQRGLVNFTITPELAQAAARLP